MEHARSLPADAVSAPHGVAHGWYRWMPPHRQATISLLLSAVVLGMTYPVLHLATQHYPPLTLNALRFLVATLCMLPLVVWQRRHRPSGFSRQGWLVAFLLGIPLFAGYALQTLGLQHATAARGGFLVSLNVPMVPLLALLVLRQRPSRWVLVGVGLALVGTTVLTGVLHAGRDAPAYTWSDGLLVLSAGAFALHIVLVSLFAQKLPWLALNTAQLGIVTICAAGMALLSEELRLPSLPLWLAIVFLGAVATALVFGIQLVMQRHTSPTRAALLYGQEPIFAALFAFLIAGEMMTTHMLQGGSLIVLGTIVAQLPSAMERSTPLANSDTPGDRPPTELNSVGSHPHWAARVRVMG